MQLRALPLLLKKDVEKRDNASLSGATDADKPKLPPTDCVSISDGTEKFLAVNNLKQNNFRCITSNAARVDLQSIENPRIGHPFLDALLFAHEHGLSFTLKPELVWELAMSAVATYLHQYELTLDALSKLRHDCTGSPDGRFRLCMADFGFSDLLEGNFHPKVWQVVSDEIDAAVRSMCGTATQIAIPLDKDNPDAEPAILDLRPRVTSMQSVNLLAERAALARHTLGQPPKEFERAKDCDVGLESLLFQGSLHDWADLLRGLSLLAKFPTFAAWGIRLLYLVDHIIAHYNKFTPQEKRAKIDPAIEQYLYNDGMRDGMQRKDPAAVFRNFITVRRDAETNAVDRIAGFALFLFPNECGYFQASPPCHPDLTAYAAPMMDFDPLEYGLTIDAFPNQISLFDCIVTTPTTEIPLKCYAGPIGWFVHEKQRAVELCGARFVVFYAPVAKVCLPAPNESDKSRATWAEEQRLIARNVQQFTSHDSGDDIVRLGGVDDLMCALNACGGSAEQLEQYIGESSTKMAKNVVLWPQAGAMEQRAAEIEQWFVVSQQQQKIKAEQAARQKEEAKQEEEKQKKAKERQLVADKQQEEQEKHEKKKKHEKQNKHQTAEGAKKTQRTASQLDNATIKRQNKRLEQQSRALERQQGQVAKLMSESKKYQRRFEEQSNKMARHAQTIRKQQQLIEKQRTTLQRHGALLERLLLAAPKDDKGDDKGDEKEQTSAESDAGSTAWQIVGQETSRVTGEQTVSASLVDEPMRTDGGPIEGDSDVRVVYLAPHTTRPTKTTSVDPTLLARPQCMREALPFRLVTKSGISDEQAVRNFVRTCAHPSAWRRVTANHYCALHRDVDMAPPQDKHFYERIVDDDEHWSLHALLTAVSDCQLNCVQCAEQIDDRMRLYSAVMTSTRHEEPPLRPLPQFVQSLYNSLASVDGGTAFRSCFVCKQEFAMDRYGIGLVLTGVDSDGSVNGRIILHCDDTDQCAGEIRARMAPDNDTDYDGGGECLSTGIAFSLRSYHNLGGDDVVRVYSADDNTTENGFPDVAPTDLQMHLPHTPMVRMMFEYDATLKRPIAVIKN